MKTQRWWEQYEGKPWRATPHPPDSYTCGELVRCALHEHFGIFVPFITADASRLRECVKDIDRPDYFGFAPFSGPIREFDVAFFRRGTKRDHVGLAAATGQGMMIVHCQQGAGVIVQRLSEMLSCGFRSVEWRRHAMMPETEALCPQ